jgi:hypothetical protein
MNRYQPRSTPRALALVAAVAFTAAMLAGVHAEAEPHPAVALPADFTGEMTAHGPVYRLPLLTVVAQRGFEVARAERGARLTVGAIPYELVAASPHN